MYKILSIDTLFVLKVVPSLTFAQPDTLWTRTFGGSGGAYSGDLVDSTGNCIIVGWKSVSGNTEDVWLVRIDNEGDTLWTKTFGGIGQEEGNAVQETSDGGFIIAGSKVVSSSLVTRSLKRLSAS